MITKADLDNVLTEVVAGVRRRTVWPFPPQLSGVMRSIEMRFNDLLDRCVDAQKELLSIQDADPHILDIQKNVYSIEAEYHRLCAMSQFLPWFMLLYIGGAAVGYIVLRVDIPKFITGTLGVEAPERLISFGISGAFLYLATSLLSKTEIYNGNI